MKYNWVKHTVLIAEDDPMNFKYLSMLLDKHAGIQIIWAQDGKAAYEEIINNSAIDIVLLDYQLPEINGLDVLVKVKRVFPEIPIIMQTANTWNGDEKKCREAGCNGYFSKPYDIEVLLEYMDACIQKYHKYKLEQQMG